MEDTAEQAGKYRPANQLTALNGNEPELETAERSNHSTRVVPLKAPGPIHRNASSPLSSQHSPRPFIPALETETQYAAAFQPFSPSMLTPNSPLETPRAALTSEDDTQPDLPPPSLSKVQSPQKRAIPPCPTSQATTVGTNFSSQYQRNTTLVPGATSSGGRTSSSTSVRTPKIKREADVVIVSSSPPRLVPQPHDATAAAQQKESPSKAPNGIAYPWDWEPVPDSQLLPDSIMHFEIPNWPGGSQESLRTEGPTDLAEAAD